MSELRISTWPGGQVSVPAFFAPEVRVEGEILDYAQTGERDPQTGLVEARGWHRVELPEELYLRELGDLDLEDREAIGEFARHWGPLGQPGLVEIAGPMSGGVALTSDRAFRDQMHSLVAPYLDPGQTFEQRSFIHVQEFVAHASLLRDLTRAWGAVSGGGSGVEVADAWESEWMPVSAVRMNLQLILVHYLNHALQAFHVRLGLVNEKGDKEVGKWEPSLFSALCLQLTNQVIAGQRYRRCDNCGRQFTVQRGRAKVGQYRREGELKYCSKHCAKAQAQRDLYRRQGEARRMHAEGMLSEAIAKCLGVKTESIERWIAPKRGRGS